MRQPGRKVPRNLAPWRDLVTGIGRDETGKWLVAYLLTRFSVAQFTEWFRSTRYGMSPDEFGASFEAAYGISMDEVWADLPSIASEQFACPLSLACTGPAVPLDGASTELFFCGEASSYRSLQVDRPTTLVLQANLPMLASVISQCSWPGFWATSLQQGLKRGNDTTVVNLEPGLYGFGVSLYKQDVASMPYFEDASLYREKPYRIRAHLTKEPILAATCGTAVPFAWSETPLDRAWATWTIPPGDVGDVQYARLIPGSGYQILLDQNVPEVSITLCDGCEGACIPAEDHNSMFPDAEGVVTIRFERVRSGGEVAPSIAWLPIEQ